MSDISHGAPPQTSAEPPTLDVTSTPDQASSTTPVIARRPLELSSAQRKALRRLGHHLKPVVQIGRDGVSEGVVDAIKEALKTHELIKVSINAEAPADRKEAGAALSVATGAHLVQVIGRVMVLFRQAKKDSKISLPKIKRKRD